MRHTIVAALFALLLVGCDNSNPVETETTSEAMFGVESMYRVATATDVQYVEIQKNGTGHDSVRHGRMLGHLKTYVGLTDVQFDSVKAYAETMFLTLKDIRTQVHDSLITREEAHALVVAAREQFVASIRLILTDEQLVLFEQWITNFWNKPPHRRGHGGRGGHGGPGGGGRP